jgi:hypothetical protein
MASILNWRDYRRVWFRFFGIGEKSKKSEKARQTVCFFYAAMKRGFIGPLPFQLKRDNQKLQGESGLYPAPLG